MNYSAEAMEAHNTQAMHYRASMALVLAEIERQHSEITLSTDVVVDLVTMLRGYEDGITWQTTCTHCASLMNQNYAQFEELARFRAIVSRVQDWKEEHQAGQCHAPECLHMADLFDVLSEIGEGVRKA